MVPVEIKWMGGPNTNSSGRGTHVPFVIVNHVSAGTMSSMDSWFNSAGNKVSSAHFGISRDGRIHQYVDIRRMAWANGATPDTYPAADKLAPVVRDKYGINPNLWTVSIEHEGYNVVDESGRIVEERGLNGDLTEAQFSASVWLHGYIRDEIVRIYGEGAWFPLDEYHVIGHFQISRSKPSCPGTAFPWTRLYEAFRKEADEPMLDRGVAETIINTWMSPSWHEADAAGNREQADYIHWLANELRRAAGMETE